MSYPRSGYKSRGARHMAEAGYQRAKARGEAGPNSRPVRERPAPGPNPYNKGGGYQPMDSGMSKGQLVPQGTVQPKGGHIDGSFRVVREVPYRDAAGRTQHVRLTLKMLNIFANLTGLSIWDTALDALITQLLGLTATPLPAGSVATQSRTFANLPLHVLWENGGTSHVTTQILTLINSRQTGQSFGSDPSTWDLDVQIGSSGYVSTWKAILNSSGFYRMNEMATYGPGVAGTRLQRATVPWGWVNPQPVHVPYPFINVKPGTEVGPPPPPKAPPVIPTLPPNPPKPPPPGVGERKGFATRALIAAVNAATEAVDLLEAAFDALPDECKAEYVRKTRKARRDYTALKKAGKAPKGPLYTNAEQVADKAKAVQSCYGHMDLDTFIFNVVSNHIEDEIYGRLGIKLPGRYGGAMGANMAFNDAFGGAQGDLLGAANQAVKDALNSLGYSIK